MKFVVSRAALMLFCFSALAQGQRPVINPGGVVNAASFVAGGLSGKAVGDGGIVAVFGTNLAPTIEAATEFPLRTTMEGVSVSVNGSPSPLLYVSPGQINFELGFFDTSRSPVLVVTTPAGSSDPYPLDFGECFGILTLDGSGCGRGVVLNVASDGSLSLNSPSNSASPGDYIAIFGTGLGGASNFPTPGLPTPLSPLSFSVWGNLTAVNFDFQTDSFGTPVSFAGKAPGWLGVDQLNVKIPQSVREGCAVPIRAAIGAQTAYSRPIPISIHKGGGQCVDPPSAGYGQIIWQRTVATGSGAADGVSETLTASFLVSPGKQVPTPNPFIQAGQCYLNVGDTFGSLSCPLPGYTSLDIGALTAQGTGLDRIHPAPTLSGGQTVYQASLPSGTIQPGSYQVSSSGGNDVDSFASTTQIGSDINITSAFPPGTKIQRGTTNKPGQPIVVNWNGGDPSSWVVVRYGPLNNAYRQYGICTARASAGTLSMFAVGLLAGPGEIVVDVIPDPSQATTFSAPGLSLGGQHSWKYTHRFGGIMFQ